MTINAHISRHAWVGWLFIYLVELIFFSTYRLSNLSDLVKTSKTPNDDTTPTRIYGVLLGIVQDFVVISFLIVVLSVFDAAINHSCCNDTAPNGCTDCFTPGIPSGRELSSCSSASCGFRLFTLYHRRYELNWSSDSEEFVVTKKQETRTATNVLVVVLATQGVVAIVTTVWFDLARWTPLGFAAQWKDENEDLSSFFDSNNRMIRGTQRPQSPAILSEDRRIWGLQL
ncbi:hypothetical protein GQ600_12153 [Phytophthora cactorum]|nr:hypothetical protein GQ600_12153 [Phytophthora cactorum]